MTYRLNPEYPISDFGIYCGFRCFPFLASGCTILGLRTSWTSWRSARLQCLFYHSITKFVFIIKSLFDSSRKWSAIFTHYAWAEYYLQQNTFRQYFAWAKAVISRSRGGLSANEKEGRNSSNVVWWFTPIYFTSVNHISSPGEQYRWHKLDYLRERPLLDNWCSKWVSCKATKLSLNVFYSNRKLLSAWTVESSSLHVCL